MGQLFDDLKQESTVLVGRPVCTVAKVKAVMQTDDERADLDRALQEPSITGAAIARKLTSVYSVPVKGQTVQRHRSGECSCG